jgi:hypothetical protein
MNFLYLLIGIFFRFDNNVFLPTVRLGWAENENLSKNNR